MIDVMMILDKLESMRLIKTSRQVGNYMQIYCPFHADGKEHKPSCGVLLNEEYRGGTKYPQGWTHCFSCGFAKPLQEMITELLKLHNINKSGFDWLIENIPDFDPGNHSELDSLISGTSFKAVFDKYAVNYLQSVTEPVQQYVSESELSLYRYTVPYMYERKLTDEIIEKFDVGYDANWIPSGRKRKTPCITFPVRDISGNTLFLCRRSITGKLYNYPKGSIKPVYGLYEIPSRCKSIIICESIINCLTCWTWGYKAVALMGTGNSYQIQQLKELGVQEFILCMDGDDAGRRSTDKLKRFLKSVAIVWTVNMPDGKDVNDLSKNEFDLLYENRE